MENIEAYGAVFYKCNFRNCNLDGAKVENTVFEKCGFYNCRGTVWDYATGETPKSQVIEPDLSEIFDGSGIIETIYDANTFFNSYLNVNLT